MPCFIRFLKSMTERAPLKPKFHAILARHFGSTVLRMRLERANIMRRRRRREYDRHPIPVAEKGRWETGDGQPARGEGDGGRSIDLKCSEVAKSLQRAAPWECGSIAGARQEYLGLSARWHRPRRGRSRRRPCAGWFPTAGRCSRGRRGSLPPVCHARCRASRPHRGHSSQCRRPH